MANIRSGSFDFSGYATKNDLLCSDGRTIRKNAFKDCDGKVVPLVWNHGGRTDPSEVLGHALLENRSDGVYMYGAFNGTEKAQIAKECVKNGDITGLSIYANSLKQKAGDVLHGVIREVSLVLSGANPGATIDFVMQHDSDSLDSFYYFLNGEECELKHSDDVEDPDDEDDDEDEDDDDEEETVRDVLKTLTDKQKAAVTALIQNAKKKNCVKHANEDDDEDEDGETVGDVLKSLTDKQKAAVAMMIEALTKEKNVKHSNYDDYEDDEYDDDYDDDYDDEFEHADGEESDRTVSEILSDLDDDEASAVEALLDAIESQETGQPSVAHSMLMHADDEESDPDEPTVGDILLNMSDEKKAAVMTVIEDMTGGSEDEEDEDEEENEEVEHSDYDYYDDDYDDYDDYDDEFEHADGEESDRTVSEILSDLDDDEASAVEALLDAIESQETGQPSVAHSMLMHADDEESDPDEPTVGDILLNMSDEKKAAVMTVIEDMTGGSEDEEDEDEENEEVEHSDYMEDDEMMKHAYDNYGPRGDVRGLFNAALDDIKRFGSLKDSVLAHAEEFGYSDLEDEWGDSLAHAYPRNEANQEITYGAADIEYLFPDAKTLNNVPSFIKRDTNWVDKFMNSTHKSPFSRVKTVFANITADEARAKGYVKGNQKIDEVFTLLKRTTDPQTVYKKQSIDRDDILDITDFDVVVWIKNEMKLQLNEELARAALVGDGRPGSSSDKISELHIRSIYNDDALYSIKANVVVPSDADDDDKAKAFIKAAIKNRKDYKGSGNPTLYTTSDMLTAMLLLEDGIGRALYSTEAELATKLRVKEIVEVPVMEGLSRADGAKTLSLAGIIVNPADYNFGADKGGQTSFFDDFDIDYNQQKYLLETRCSGALTVPYSAIVLEIDPSGDAAHTTNP